MAYSDTEIKTYTKKLESAGASIDDITEFVSRAKNEQVLSISKQERGNDSFLKRLQLSFGTEEERESRVEPKGFLAGGLSEIPKDIADVAGKTLPMAGMVVGGLVGGASGNVPGAIIGSGAGAAVGERMRQDIGRTIGVQKGGEMEKLKEVGFEGAMGAFAEVGGRVLSTVAKPVAGKTIKPIISGARDMVKNIISTLTSVPEGAISKAFSNVEVREGFKKTVSAKTIRDEMVNTFKAIKNKTMSGFGKRIKELESKPAVVDKKVKSEYKEIVSFVKTKMESFGVKLKGNKIIEFPKKIRGEAQKNVQEAWSSLIEHKDFTVKGMQALMEDIQSFQKYTAAGLQAKSTPLVSSMSSSVNGFIKKTLPDLAQLRTGYATQMQILQQIDDVIKANIKEGQKGSVSAIHSAIGKLTNIFKEDKDAYIDAILKLEKMSGKSFLNKLAGTEFQHVSPGILRTSLAVGGLSQLVKSPFALAIVPLFSPRFWGGVLTRKAQAQTIIDAILKNYTSKDVAPAAIKIIINNILKGVADKE